MPQADQGPPIALEDDLPTRLKRVLRFMPAPVGIITTCDADGSPAGLAMSAIMPVSLEPCAMAVCVNRTSSAHRALLRSGRFCINLLGPDKAAHVLPFASAEAKALRFSQTDWRQWRGGLHDGMWHIDAAPATLFCTVRGELGFGTHDLLVGEVDELIASGSDDILGWANGGVCRLAPLA